MNQVTVIIPFFETPLVFLREAIESVLAQTYREWVLLLVNDGSKGECVALAQGYAERHPQRVRVPEHEGCENRGLSATRKFGIRESDTEYVAFLDADDVWLPNKLEEQVALLDAHPAAQMLYGNSLYWYSWSGDPEDAVRDHQPALGVEPDRVVSPPDLLPAFLRGTAAVPCPCSVMLRRDVLERVQGIESRLLDIYEDQVMYAKVCLEHPVFVSARCWDKYRQHPESMCAVAERDGRQTSFRRMYLEWLLSYLGEKGYSGGPVRRVAERELWMARRPLLGRWIKRMERALRRAGAAKLRRAHG